MRVILIISAKEESSWKNNTDKLISNWWRFRELNKNFIRNHTLIVKP